MRRIPPPTDQQFETAIMWLESNEGTEGEADACRAVASWIEMWRHDDMLRRTAREAGVSVSALRKKLAGRSTTIPDEIEN